MIKNVKKTKTNTKNSGTGIIPLSDRVLIKENTKNTESRTASGIIVPITVSEDKGSKRGEIVAVGPGHYEEKELIPVSVSVGDEVLFQWGDKVKIDNEEYYIVKESELLAIIK